LNEEKRSADINTDAREQFDWKSKYPPEARKEIFLESVYVLFFFFLSFALLLLNYFGLISSLFALDESRIIKFEYIVYFSSAGILGGTVFGMKYFYRVVARGYWTQDRRYWRILSPFISMGIAFIIGCMSSIGILTTYNSSTNTWAVAFGFFAGYFADEAVGKMYEIATLIFGKTTKK
jgi:hypothetical protein